MWPARSCSTIRRRSSQTASVRSRSPSLATITMRRSRALHPSRTRSTTRRRPQPVPLMRRAAGAALRQHLHRWPATRSGSPVRPHPLKGELQFKFNGDPAFLPPVGRARFNPRRARRTTFACAFFKNSLTTITNYKLESNVTSLAFALPTRHAWLLSPGCGVTFSHHHRLHHHHHNHYGPAGPVSSSPSSPSSSRVLRLSLSAQQKRINSHLGADATGKKKSTACPASNPAASNASPSTTGGKMIHSRRPLTRSVLRASLSPLAGTAGGASATGPTSISSPILMKKSTSPSNNSPSSKHFLHHPRRIPSPK